MFFVLAFGGTHTWYKPGGIAVPCSCSIGKNHE